MVLMCFIFHSYEFVCNRDIFFVIVTSIPTSASIPCKSGIWKLARALDCDLINYNDVIISAMSSQITSPTIVYSTVYPEQRKHQSFASLAFVWRIHRWPVKSLHKGPVTREMFPFDDVIMFFGHLILKRTDPTWSKNSSWVLQLIPF